MVILEIHQASVPDVFLIWRYPSVLSPNLKIISTSKDKPPYVDFLLNKSNTTMLEDLASLLTLPKST